MKKILFLIWISACHFTSFSQGVVGIGTTSPNSKSILDLTSTSQGLLIPRMTSTDRVMMALTPDDAGMMVFQTSPSTKKGLYIYDGTAWVGINNMDPQYNGVNGATLRWDGANSAWVNTTNLFNQGSGIGIGTLNPNVQLHIHSNSVPSARIQITSGSNNAFLGDGLLLGLTLSNNYAHINQQENRPLWFGTNGVERMRIDSTGNVGINKTNPAATLDVNGTLKMGANGTIINGIMHSSVMINIPPLSPDSFGVMNIEFPNAIESATVHISPGAAMTDIMIAYARVSAPNNVQIKFMNMDSSASNDQDEMMFYITIIQ